MLEEIRTARLLLTRPQSQDFDAYVQLQQSPRVMATLGGVRQMDLIKIYFDKLLSEWTQFGFSLWTIRDLASGQFAGRGGPRRVNIEGRDEVEVGYAFMPEFWGRGYATELARESIQIGFTQLKLPELISFTQITNLASRRVMEKAGFRYERDFIYANTPQALYRQKAP